MKKALQLLLPVLTLFSVSHGGNLLDSANAAFTEGRSAEAIALYQVAARNGENPALCYFNMANAYFQLDSLPHSIVFYRACTALAPDFYRAHLNLAVAYFTLEDLGACIATVNRALRIQNDDLKAWLVLAAAYRKAGSVGSAIATFEQVVLRFPDAEEPYLALAEMYRDLEDPEAAITWLTKYPPEGKNRAYVNIMLADILESQNEPARALYYLQRSWELDSSNRWVYYRMMALHQKMGNSMIALEQIRLGLKQLKDFGELALLGGNIAFENGSIDEAERLYGIARDNGSPGGVVGLENVRIVKTTSRN